ncbi:MAG: right-handed parallel beta-helix repeat-containing protein [Opitutaceae bacterium]|jgi:parallel beta-helix repeat protein
MNLPTLPSFFAATIFSGLISVIATPTKANVELRVGEGERFITIQAAVDAVPARPDQPYVIVVKPGIYAESVKITGKDTSPRRSLTIKSEKLSRAIIDTGDKPHAFHLLDQNNVILDGLTLKGGNSYGTVFLQRASQNTISRCVIQGSKTYDGITLSGSTDNLIEKNILLKNARAGIFLINRSRDNTIRFNIITLNKWGVFNDTSTDDASSEPVLEQWNDYYGNQSGNVSGFTLSDTSLTADPVLIVENNTVRLSTRSDFLRWSPAGEATPESPAPKSTK